MNKLSLLIILFSGTANLIGSEAAPMDIDPMDIDERVFVPKPGRFYGPPFPAVLIGLDGEIIKTVEGKETGWISWGRDLPYWVVARNLRRDYGLPRDIGLKAFSPKINVDTEDHFLELTKYPEKEMVPRDFYAWGPGNQPVKVYVTID